VWIDTDRFVIRMRKGSCAMASLSNLRLQAAVTLVLPSVGIVKDTMNQPSSHSPVIKFILMDITCERTDWTGLGWIGSGQ
jgi:hypothetical protein